MRNNYSVEGLEAGWNLAFFDPTTTSFKVWLGVLKTNRKKKDNLLIEILDTEGKLIQSISSGTIQWRRPFQGHERGFYSLLTINDLTPNTRYQVRVTEAFTQPDSNAPITDPGSGEPMVDTLIDGQCKTLPVSLPNNAETPFCVLLGSCLSQKYDGHSASNAVHALCDKESEKYHPDISVLAGDQVYLDLGIRGISTIPEEISEYVGEKYAEAWMSLEGFLRNSACVNLADDHEFWNNYPDFSTNEAVYLYPLRDKQVRSAFTAAALDGVRNVQQVKPVRIIKLGNDLSFCFADMRSDRTIKPRKLMNEDHFSEVLNWAEHLTTPGVLAIPQALFVEKGNGFDYNLPNFKDDYSRLLAALAKTGNDILILTGDVHYGRVAKSKLGNANIYEVIASPLSNIPGFSGTLATATPPTEIPRFPQISVPGLPGKSKVTTIAEIEEVSDPLDFRYPDTRTREHFATLGFSKTEGAGIQVDINYWAVRKFYKSGSPKKLESCTIYLK
ncbi:hypothetical protein ACNKU7_04520 [Microbulbifer sp. SA54]|uniref:hypothetical protein n=1 Tax=Microbulbifer sp. SA54 TaxID=3401577 RepID=UPI003AAB9EC3